MHVPARWLQGLVLGYRVGLGVLGVALSGRGRGEPSPTVAHPASSCGLPAPTTSATVLDSENAIDVSPVAQSGSTFPV
jgi:hypothetical protein